MALTPEQLLEGFSRFIGDWYESTTTALGTTTQLYDTGLGAFGPNLLVDNWFRLTSGTNDNEIRRALPPFTPDVGLVTVQPAFTNAVASGVTYEMHKYHPRDKWNALNAARLAILPWVFQEVRDDTLMGDGRSDEFVIPSTVEWGPEVAYIEHPLDVDADWNLLETGNARGKSAEDWTASAAVTASTYAKNIYDKQVPKHEDTCVKLVYTDAGADGTYTLASFKAAAADFAGRTVEFGIWLHCETTGPVAEITTNAGTLATSDAHQGRGWEFLKVSGDIPQSGVSAVSVRVRFPNSGAAAHRVAYRENAFFAFGRLPSMYHEDAAIETTYDGTLRLVQLRGIPLERRQIRLIGKAPLTALEDSNPPTSSMEVDEKSAQILYAEAAEQLFGLELLTQPAQRDVAARIAVVKDKRKEYQKAWKHRAKQGRFVSPFAW